MEASETHVFGAFLLPEPAKPITDAQMRWSLYTPTPLSFVSCWTANDADMVKFSFLTAVPFLWCIPLSLPDCGQPSKRQPPFPKRDTLRSENAVKALGFFNIFFQEPKSSFLVFFIADLLSVND